MDIAAYIYVISAIVKGRATVSTFDFYILQLLTELLCKGAKQKEKSNQIWLQFVSSVFKNVLINRPFQDVWFIRKFFLLSLQEIYLVKLKWNPRHWVVTF